MNEIEILNCGLKVTDIRYFQTRRGVGYECQTNVKGITIWNDGNGGATFLDGAWADKKQFQELRDMDLENLINIFEKQPIIN
jgi:hypothetical protein|tara:strand:- start:684 stop:929 length:246 start_codon:yes stop_codon:yes gene_type:complete